MLIPAVAVLGALIPTVLYVLAVWWLDRYEKEPLWLLALAFFWGAVPATILSALMEYLIDIPIYELVGGGLAANLVSNSVGAPLVEEMAKGLALLLLVLFFPREFDDELDGIVYGAMIGFGFALTENSIAYFLPILRAEGIGIGLLNIMLRSVVFGFNHALWSAILGASVGYARACRKRSRRILIPLGGWLLAVALHATHNAAATLASQTYFVTLGLSAILGWSGVVVLLGVAAMALRREARWIELGLSDEIRLHTISVKEYDILRSASQRLWVRTGSLVRGGPPAYRAVGHYFQVATELAFKKHHRHKDGDKGATAAEESKRCAGGSSPSGLEPGPGCEGRSGSTPFAQAPVECEAYQRVRGLERGTRSLSSERHRIAGWF